MSTHPTVNVDSTPIPAALGVLVRQVSLILGALVALMSFVRERDIMGLIEYLASSDFATAVGVLVGLLSLLWSYIRALRNWRNLNWLAGDVPDSVAKVTPFRLFKG